MKQILVAVGVPSPWPCSPELLLADQYLVGMATLGRKPGMIAAAHAGAAAILEQSVLLVVMATVVLTAWRHQAQRAVTAADQDDTRPEPASLRP